MIATKSLYKELVNNAKLTSNQQNIKNIVKLVNLWLQHAQVVRKHFFKQNIKNIVFNVKSI